MKRIALAAASALSLTFAVPAWAQDDAQTEAAQMDQAMAKLAEAFPAEPLTAEQEARLPQARRIIATMIPEGTLSEMMGSTFDKLLGPMMNAMGAPSIGTVTEATGLTTFDLELTDEQAAELALIIDPALEQRREIEMTVFPELMGEMMAAMEPGMRKAMSELYAINFTQTELDEIEAFFNTESGASFARKSFTMSSDPRIVSATMESLPAMMGTITGIEQRMKDETADLPAKRTFAELSDAEKARIAEVTGYTVAEIEANLASAQAE